MTLCELYEKPEFLHAVDQLRDTFGTEAETIAYKHFMENGGSMPSTQEIIDAEKAEYFSPLNMQSELPQASNRPEITMTKKAIFDTIGIASPKLQLSDKQIRNLKAEISKTNNLLYKEGKNMHFGLVDVKQVGQADLFTWRVAVYPGKVNMAAKAEKTRENAQEKNRLPGTLGQGTLDLFDGFAAYQRSDISQTTSFEAISQFAKKLAEQIGYDYAFITPEEAVEITKNTRNPYTNEKALFVGDKVYFVGTNFDASTLVHEFSHPLIRGIAKSNIKVFDKLYDDLALTEDGKRVIAEVEKLYPEYDRNSVLFKEEALVRALTEAANLKNEDIAIDNSFKKLIDNLLYQIRQLLRKVFGSKVDVSKLDGNTKLEDLASMLRKGEIFDVTVEKLGAAEFAAYQRETTNQMNDLTKVDYDVQEIEDLTNKYFNLVSKQLTSLRKEEKYPELLDILQNKYKTGELQQMKKNLKPYQTLIQQDAKKMEDEMELTRQRAMAAINSMNNLANMVTKIHEGLKEIVKDANSPENVAKAMYYQNTLNYWNEFVTSAADTLEKDGVSIPAINKINASIRRSNDLLNKFYKQAVGDVLWSQLAPVAENINKKWDERIKELEKKKAPTDVIAKAKKQAENEKISLDTITKALNGELKDLSFAGAWLEAYSYSPDPVVGGLSAFIKDGLTEIEAVAQKNVNQQADELSPLLKENGYNPNKAGQLGKDLGQKEKIGKVNPETGEFEEVEVWRFLNEFIGADLARDQYHFKIKQASQKYQETKSEDDAKKLADIQAEWEQHRRNFFNQEYTEAFYKAWDLFKNDDIGREAKARMDDYYDRINALQNSLADAENELEIASEIESVRRELKQLSSLTNEFGDKKTGKDLEIAERIRQYNEISRDLYYEEEIPGAFLQAYENYKQKLISEGKGPGTEDYDRLLSKWKSQNTRVVVKDDFWETLNDVNERIRQILSSVPNDVAQKLAIEEDYKIVKEYMTGFRDESGQPVGAEMSEEKLRRVKEAQERITKAQEYLNSTTGLTKMEKLQLEEIYARFDAGESTEADRVLMNRLLDKQELLGLDKFQRQTLRALYEKLDELRQREATDSYVDTVNAYLREMGEKNPLFGKVKSLEITKENAYLILNEEILAELFEASPAFENWFNNNHYRRPSIDETTGEKIEKWDRTYAWNMIRPKDPNFFKKTYIKDDAGNVIEEIDGVPAMKYFKRLVKDEYITKQIVGVTVDNTGRWLPKTVAQGAKDDRYINKDYFAMKRNNPTLFKLLEKSKEIHLRNQKGMSSKSRLWMDYPRYRKQTVERLQSENPVIRIIQRIKDFFTKVRDGWDQGFNFNDDLQLVKMDLMDDETTGIPVSGLSNLDIEEVSTDLTLGMMKYMLSGIKQKKLIEMAPVARAIQKVVNDKSNFPFAQKTIENRSIINLNKKSDKYLRAQAINNLIEKTFEGKMNVGWGSDNATVQNFSNTLFKQASFAYLSLNIPSAIKNTIGMKWQGLIESAAGKYMSMKDFTASEAWATETSFRISSEIYKRKSKSLNVQLVELFDPERDRFSSSIGESLSRTPLKDSLLPLERLNDFRKFSQLQASLQIFAGMMKHEKVEQTINGETKSIPYLEAWEVVDGKLQLKKGIDKEWGITYLENGEQQIGSKFLQKKKQIHRVMDNLNGAMALEVRPEADRYLLFRYISFFRRWMTSMFTNRFAYSGSLLKGTSRGRYDYQLGDVHEGFYITNMKFLYKTFASMGKYLPYASKEEKAAMMRLGTEIGTLILASALTSLIFNWDDDDDQRFAKLRAKSGPLPFFFIDEDPNRPFNLHGWLSNHVLLMLMQTKGENDQFLPFPGFGLSDYKSYLDLKSLVFGPTLKAYADIAQDIGFMATGDDSAYYQKDVSPYSFGKQGEAKIWNHIAKAFGMSGSSIDPANAIKNFQSAQNR